MNAEFAADNEKSPEETIHGIVDDVISQASDQPGVIRAHEVLAEVDAVQKALPEPPLQPLPEHLKTTLDVIKQMDGSEEVEDFDVKSMLRAAIFKAVADRVAKREKRRYHPPIARFFPPSLPDYLQDSPHDDPYDD